MTLDFKKFLKIFWTFPYYWFLLKSYHIILKLTALIGFKKTCSRSQIKFFWRKNYCFKWLRPFLSLFSWLFGFCLFCWCFKSNGCDVVMFFWFIYAWKTSPYSFRSIFERIDWLLLKSFELNGCLEFKNNFSKFFWRLTNLKIFVNC